MKMLWTFCEATLLRSDKEMLIWLKQAGFPVPEINGKQAPAFV
jgi:hypothetical protein